MQFDPARQQQLEHNAALIGMHSHLTQHGTFHLWEHNLFNISFRILTEVLDPEELHEQAAFVAQAEQRIAPYVEFVQRITATHHEPVDPAVEPGFGAVIDWHGMRAFHTWRGWMLEDGESPVPWSALRPAPGACEPDTWDSQVRLLLPAGPQTPGVVELASQLEAHSPFEQAPACG